MSLRQIASFPAPPSHMVCIGPKLILASSVRPSAFNMVAVPSGALLMPLIAEKESSALAIKPKAKNKINSARVLTFIGRFLFVKELAFIPSNLTLQPAGRMSSPLSKDIHTLTYCIVNLKDVK